MPGNAVIMLKLKELIKVRKVKPCRFFFLLFLSLFFSKCQKNWGVGGSTTLNEEKRGMPLFNIVIVLPSEYKSMSLQGQERAYTK